MRMTHTRGGQPTVPGFFVNGLAIVLLTCVLVACGGPAPVPLSPTFTTKDAAVTAFLQALAARDRATLANIAITEPEFRKHIWPALPASEASVGMPLDYVWTDSAQKNAGFLAQLLDEHGGRSYRLIAASFAGETTDYGGFRVHRKTTLDLQGPNGPVTLRLFGSMIESGGHWKIYSFVGD